MGFYNNSRRLLSDEEKAKAQEEFAEKLRAEKAEKEERIAELEAQGIRHCLNCRKPTETDKDLCSESCAGWWLFKSQRIGLFEARRQAALLGLPADNPQYIRRIREEQQKELELSFPCNAQIERRGAKYGLDLESTKALLKQPCAVCLAPASYKNVIDHDHETDIVRGVVCFACNQMLSGIDRLNRLGLEAMDRAIEHVRRGYRTQR